MVMQQTVVIPISDVQERPNSYCVTHAETKEKWYLTKRWYVKFYPNKVVIPLWYAEKIGDGRLVKKEAPE